MSTNPYEAPGNTEVMAEPSINIPEEVTKQIKRAGWAGVVSGSLTLLIALISIFGGPKIMGLDAKALVDVVLIFGLAFGIFKKSRTCAILMLVYFGGTKLWQIFTFGFQPGMVTGFFFLYFYFMGVMGTFEYHKLRRG